MDTTLLIDGKNTAYRALFAAIGNPDYRNSGCHPFAVWLRLTHVWLEKFKPDSVHVFWDCPKNEVWRKKIAPEYKDHRDAMPHYDDNVQLQLHNLIDAATNILPKLGVRQYTRPRQEADDLIYAACRMMAPCNSDRKLMVISSDSDFLQLQWQMPHVLIYGPKTGRVAERPECDPAMQKALCGDKSDNIEGFRGIGPVKSKQLVSDPQKLVEFLRLADEQKFRRNLALIDLSLNPATLSTQLYILTAMVQEVEYDRAAATDLGIKYHVRGLIGELPKCSLAFKRLK